MGTENRYLRVTIHDNDFRGSLELIGDLLFELFYTEGYPTEEQLPALKECIKHLWFSAEMAVAYMRWGNVNSLPMIDNFMPHLEFVWWQEIPDWDNGESIYIPMFDDGKVLRR